LSTRQPGNMTEQGTNILARAAGLGPTPVSQLLLVDDNRLNRERLAGFLQVRGYKVTTASGGTMALDLLRAESFDLVLLDSMMPEPNGLQVLEIIKTDPALRDIPVVMISGLDEIEIMVRCIQLGATDYVSSPFDPVLLSARIDACLENKRLRAKEVLFLHQLQKEKQHSDQLVNVVIPIGISLLEEKNVNRLLETILLEAKSLANADGGTLYLRTEDQRLKFVMLKNDSLKTSLGGTSGAPIPFPPLNLHDPQTGKPNHSQVACHVALTATSVNIPDAYNADGFDFHGTRAFDQKTGYRSTSFLTVPLKNKRNEVIGVLQLINATHPKTGKVVPFDPALQQSIESLSLLAAAALDRFQKGLTSQPT
jgi:CheY-like chemotaxis protein